MSDRRETVVNVEREPGPRSVHVHSRSSTGMSVGVIAALLVLAVMASFRHAAGDRYRDRRADRGACLYGGA